VLTVPPNRINQLQSFAEGEFMAHLEGLVRIVKQLRVERTNLVDELKHVDAALAVLGKLDGGSSYTKPRRTLSAAARRKIAAAQKARWAKVKAGSKPAAGAAKTTVSTHVKRTISAAGRKRIAAAQRARWAKVRAGKKKAA
jgi:hypothetical protein